MLFYNILVIFTRIVLSLCERIVFSYKIDVENSNNIHLIGRFHGVDASDCLELCKRTHACMFITYHRLAQVCGIIGQTTPMVLSSTKVRHAGYIYWDKSDWTGGSGNILENAGCGPPLSINMTTRLGNMFTPGDVTQYVCNNNHSVTTRATCQIDGSWSDTNLVCITDCAPAPTLHNSDRSESSTTVGTHIIYTCNYPYSRAETIVCQQDGTWSPLSIQCIPEECYTSPHTGVYTYKSSCYKYIPTIQPWDNARTNCETLGGYLAAISDAAETAAVWTYIQTIPGYSIVSDVNRIYIGLTDMITEGTFTWLDGNVTTFGLWAAREPDGGTRENCVAFTTFDNTMYWYDMACTRVIASMCEFPLQ